MQTRRDQLHAYRFLTKRALAALVTGEPNAVEPPMRRLTLTTVSGVMIAVLVAAGFALVGVLRPSAGKSWQAAGTIVVERETGARFIYLRGRLDPVLNFSSGVLAVSGAGQLQAHVTLVDRSEIADVPRGPTIGIDAIPDSLPPKSSLVTSPWTVCSRQRAGKPTQLLARVSLLVGADAGRALPSSQSVVVRSVSDGKRYLLWNGQRLLIESDAVATLLNLQSTDPLVVGTAFLDGLLPGPALRTPQLDHVGSAGPTVAGHPTTVGQLIVATDTQQSFVALAGGVEPISPVEARLIASLPAVAQVPSTLRTVETDVIGVPQVRDARLDDQVRGLPIQLPSPATTAAQNGGICAVYTSSLPEARFSVPPSELPLYRSNTVSQSPTSSRGSADIVLVRAGRAAIVRSADGSPTTFVVVAPGKKYAFSDSALLTAFGYAGVTPTTLPGQLLPLIPTGPALDPRAALRPVSR